MVHSLHCFHCYQYVIMEIVIKKLMPCLWVQ
uniref:Uncharacterized protein n=1 Tax=Anguilla anguilla TaxID=7936 RepID=A0A0E9Q9T4_ANGAN